MCISFSRDRKNKNRACLLSTTNEDPWRFLLNIMESVYILHCLEVIAPSRFLCSSVLTLSPPRRVTKTWVGETIIAIIKITITIITIIMKLILKARFYFVLFYFFCCEKQRKFGPRKNEEKSVVASRRKIRYLGDVKFV